MLKLEIETLDLTDAIPDSAADLLEEKLSELAALEEQQSERRRRLAADAEVGRLLSGE
jgi:hypothetical protein